MGWAANVRHRTARQERMEAAIRKAGGSIWHDYEYLSETPPGPKVVRWLLGEHAFAPVTGLVLTSGISGELPAACPDLQSLQIRNVNDEGESFRHIARFRRLYGLVLEDSPISAKALASLTNLPDLQLVVLKGTSATDENIAALAGLSQLRILRIREAKLRNPPLYLLKALSRLEHFELDENSQGPVLSVSFLKDLRQLKSVALKRVRLNGSSLEDLSELTQLEQLMMENVAFCGDTMNLPRLPPQIRVITLVNTSINVESLRVLCRCKGLTGVTIQGPQFGDAVANVLAMLPHLKRLDIGGTGISDTGLAQLQSLRNLSRLNISVDRGLTKAGADAFAKRCPDCSVGLYRNQPNTDKLDLEFVGFLDHLEASKPN